MKCLYRQELLFHEEPSTTQQAEEDLDLEPQLENKTNSQESQQSWDDGIDDFPDDESFPDINNNEVFVQTITQIVITDNYCGMNFNAREDNGTSRARAVMAWHEGGQCDSCKAQICN